MKGDWDDDLTVWDEFHWDSPDSPQTAPKRRKKTNPRTMASNPTPDNNDILRALADRLADGCHQLEVELGIKQNMEAPIRADIAALGMAELQAGVKKNAVALAYDTLQAADTAGTKGIANCKLRLQKVLGQKWSSAWEPTGFPNGSVAMPDAQDERFTLLNSLKNYFTLVPAHESVEMEATAALCDAAWTTLSNARQGVSNAESAQTAAFGVRTGAESALRTRVRGLIHELEQLLSDDDARWEDFGLNIPGNPSAPEPVASVAVAPASNHRLEVSWPYATRAIRYRVEGRIVGGAPEWENKGSFKDLEAILKGFTAGQIVELRLIASNDGGDAAPSPVATATVG